MLPSQSAAALTLASLDCGADRMCGGAAVADDTVVDAEPLTAVIEIVPATTFETMALAVAGADVALPVPGDGLLSVIDGGRVEAVYSDGSGATASARVRCTPAVSILNVVRRGTNARFGVQGGCDPRARVDPR